MNDDERLMRRALELAAWGRGLVEPNPLVGAIVLDSTGALVGEGWHRRFGGPHAEVHALHEAGERARDGTLIVTLEPCCHWGKTPPCTDAILSSGIRRIVAAMQDPFPRVAGGGLAVLAEAGLEVKTGVYEVEARRLNAAYLKLLRTGKPWVHLKWAMTLDGKIATRAGNSRWISGEESRQVVHTLRGQVDAIVVGRGTVEADDPLLTARPAGPRVAARIIITASGRLPERCQLRSTAGQFPVIIFTSQENQHRLASWAEAGAEVFALPSSGSQLSLEQVLAELGRRRSTHVLVEGGSELLGAFVSTGLADEFHVFVAPKLIGGQAAPSPTGGRGIERMADSLMLSDFTSQPLGADVYLHGYSAGVFA